MTSTAPTVLVFDSGVGSLSIGREIHARLPSLNLLYAMDNGGFPYGEWEEQRLSLHICETVLTLVERYQPDLMVLACNSASTTVLPALRAALNIPVVGVVPAIKPASALSESRVIGLLATPGTVSRQYTARLIDDFAADCCVIAVGSAQLAPAIEYHFRDGRPLGIICEEIAAEFTQHPRFADMDTLVLACTHFPLVDQALAKHFPGVKLVDSGEAIARRVESLLRDSLEHGAVGEQHAILVGDGEAGLSQHLADVGIQSVERISER